MCALQDKRIATESPEERAARLQVLKQNRNAEQDTDHPLFEQCHARERILKFHQELWSLQTVGCLTCLEKFPGTKMSLQSECLRCQRDKMTPKLYSSANNMSPGSIPLELQVI